MIGSGDLGIYSGLWIGVGRVERLVGAIRCNDTCKASSSHLDLNVETVQCRHERGCIAPTADVTTRSLSIVQVKAQAASCCPPHL